MKIIKFKNFIFSHRVVTHVWSGYGVFECRRDMSLRHCDNCGLQFICTKIQTRSAYAGCKVIF